MTETGNPNFPTNFKGRYEITPTLGSMENDKTMLTSGNIVEFMGNCQLDDYTANTTFGVLHNDCSPLNELRIPICVNDGTEHVEIMNISSNGELSLSISSPSIVVFLRGVSFNISGNFY